MVDQLRVKEHPAKSDNFGPGTLQFNDDNVWKQDDISPVLMVYF